jgi:uncharacterized protein (DUF1800 family)
MITLNCATGSIAPYVPSPEQPWNKERAMHLFRRMGFGAPPDQIQNALEQNPSDVVDAILDAALALPPSPAPLWANWTVQDYTNFPQEREQQLFEWMTGWMQSMLENGFREKLALFWHNHFVTQFTEYQCPSYMYQYLTLLQENSLGNFKTFVHAVGTTPAMLVFLNGVQNTSISPNENYARELYELFTLGQDNGYTQDDIEETARALTGWVGYAVGCGPIGFVSVLHDADEKTIFGQTGNWGYDEVHDLLFEQRADLIATFICSKIYRHFVHPEVDEGIVEEMAATFKENNFELAPVFRQIFKSEHFFDPYVIGTEVKSPVEHFLTFIKDGGFQYNSEVLEIMVYYSYLLGQTLFNPIDVAGWQGNRTWIDTNTLTGRWQSLGFYIYFIYENYPELLVDLARTLTGDSNDPDFIAQEVVNHFTPNGLNSPEAYDRATDVFKWEVPENYFDTGAWNLNWPTASIQVAVLLEHISKLPEFQLM